MSGDITIPADLQPFYDRTEAEAARLYGVYWRDATPGTPVDADSYVRAERIELARGLQAQESARLASAAQERVITLRDSCPVCQIYTGKAFAYCVPDELVARNLIAEANATRTAAVRAFLTSGKATADQLFGNRLADISAGLQVTP